LPDFLQTQKRPSQSLFETASFFVPLRKMKHHLTILHAGITRFKHFMYKQQEEGKLKK